MYVRLSRQGLIVSSRMESLQHFKKPFAHEHESVDNLLDAVKVNITSSYELLHTNYSSRHSYLVKGVTLPSLHCWDVHLYTHLENGRCDRVKLLTLYSKIEHSSRSIHFL